MNVVVLNVCFRMFVNDHIQRLKNWSGSVWSVFLIHIENAKWPWMGMGFVCLFFNFHTTT